MVLTDLYRLRPHTSVLFSGQRLPWFVHKLPHYVIRLVRVLRGGRCECMLLVIYIDWYSKNNGSSFAIFSAEIAKQVSFPVSCFPFRACCIPSSYRFSVPPRLSSRNCVARLARSCRQADNGPSSRELLCPQPPAVIENTISEHVINPSPSLWIKLMPISRQKSRILVI